MKRAGRAAWRIAAALLIVSAAHLPSRAGLPDWAKSVAEAAPPVPEGMPDWPQRILFWERRISLDPGGATWQVSERSAVQVLSNRVDDVAFKGFVFDDTTKVKKSKGWHVPPGERAQRNLGGAVDIAVGDDFLSDARARAVALEGARKGSLLFYEFDAEAKPYTLTMNEPLYDSVPISYGRWVVDLPAGWTLAYAWLPGGGPEPTRQGSTWTFELRDVVPSRPDRLGVDPLDAAPRLVLAMTPPAGTLTPAASFPDWNGLGRWWLALSKGRDAADPAIQRKAREVVAGAGPGLFGRVRALALFTRDRVRYLAREVGIGGYQPHAAPAVLSDLYGDCKDKGTLFRALLAADGIASYPIFVNATLEHTVSPTVPSPAAFDHFVVGVVWPKDEPVPAEIAAAVVDVPALGRLLVVDTTDEYAWPGTLCPTLAGKTALVVGAEGGTLVTLPPGDPAANRIDTTATATLRPDGSASIALRVTYSGWEAEVARASHARSSEDRRKEVEQEVVSSWPGAQVRDYGATPETPAGAYVETLQLEIPAGAGYVQDGDVAFFSGASRQIDRVSVTKRDGPVVYPCARTLRFEETLVGVPAAAALPPAQDAAGDGWSARSAVDRQGDSVHGVWTFVRSRIRFEPAAFPELKKMWSAAARAASLDVRVAP